MRLMEILIFCAFGLLLVFAFGLAIFYSIRESREFDEAEKSIKDHREGRIKELIKQIKQK